jgi:hypothetical protein
MIAIELFQPLGSLIDLGIGALLACRDIQCKEDTCQNN